MSYFIGIDVGTSATKSVLFDETGKIVFSNSSEYELIQPHNGWAQQRPNDWENATLKTLKSIAQKVNSDEIKGIGVSGQMHGLVVLDENNDVLYDSIIWCDQRTEKEVNQIIDTIGKERYIDLTLNAPNTSFTLSKLLWLKNNEPDIFSKTRKVLLPKDYINFCLTGNFSTDVSDASGTGYFDVKGRCWSEEILNAFDIDKELLPQVYESSQVVGNITEDMQNKQAYQQIRLLLQEQEIKQLPQWETVLLNRDAQAFRWEQAVLCSQQLTSLYMINSEERTPFAMLSKTRGTLWE